MAQLAVPLPYGLAPRDFFRTIEDVHDLLHDLNSLLHERQYERLEELLDPAGFSGLISRTVANRLARASRGLVVNQYHNGYPDLLVRGQYPGDAVQHGEGGLEVKASRYAKGWQSHGPRAGWFAVQFHLDERTDVAVHDPAYKEASDRLANEAKLGVLRDELPELLLDQLRQGIATADQLVSIIGPARGIEDAVLRPRVHAALRKLRAHDRIRLDGSRFALAE